MLTNLISFEDFLSWFSFRHSNVYALVVLCCSILLAWWSNDDDFSSHKRNTGFYALLVHKNVPESPDTINNNICNAAFFMEQKTLP